MICSLTVRWWNWVWWCQWFSCLAASPLRALHSQGRGTPGDWIWCTLQLINARCLHQCVQRGQGMGEDKRGYFRFLNLITWVKFDNEECAADTGDNGTCYTRWGEQILASYQLFGSQYNISPQPWCITRSTECAQYGGVAQGSCAAGFGVCCVLQVPHLPVSIFKTLKL